jgi:UDP-N-acetylmuramoyl-tripeptide--D-alanyl-D-alanine ligase
MWRTTVIAITGSVGKTTAKDCLATILASRAPTHRTLRSQNTLPGVPRTLLGIRPWHRYAVVEIGTDGFGHIRRGARLVRPDVAVLLGVARTHTKAFRSLEATAAEKSDLLRYVPKSGTAILNADDPYVREMGNVCRGRVVFFGSGSECDVAVERSSSVWPERLTLTVRAGDARAELTTKLVGTHWTGSVLAAVAAALACGFSLEEASSALRTMAPTTARMQPVRLPNGAIVIRDEHIAAPDSVDAMFEVLREARAGRRILVISDLSDSKARPKRRQQDLGRFAAEHCGFALFVSDSGHHAVRAAIAAGMDPAQCRHVLDPLTAAELLREELRAGDLVFLKGRMSDHLSRVLFAQFGEIGCWVETCGLRYLCDVCPKLEPSFELEATLESAARSVAEGS